VYDVEDERDEQGLLKVAPTDDTEGKFREILHTGFTLMRMDEIAR